MKLLPISASPALNCIADIDSFVATRMLLELLVPDRRQQPIP